MKPLLDGLRALGTPKLAAMGVVAAIVLGMLGVLMTQGGQKPMALLYGDLDLREAGQMAELLDKSHIPHTLSGDDRIMVPADQVAAARLLLAKDGLPSGGSVGYEIFDRGDNLTATQFEQTINQTRALEGELSRSIRLISGVRGARVHLVLPHREPFATEQVQAQASVLLSMSGGSHLDPEAVQAVINLVSAAVPGLRAQNIAIIDNHGTVLARAGAPFGADGAAGTAEEQKHAMEMRLSRAVEEMLEPSLGADHVRAEAAVTMNTDQVRETSESYDPNQQVLRSQQTVSDKTRSTEPDQSNTSVQNNLPNAPAASNAAGSQGDRREETNNYEIGKTVRTLVQDQPRLQRISLAVMVDGSMVKGADGKSVWQPRSKAELDQISTLVKSAIGYDEKRGDTVSVVSMPFVDESIEPPPVPAGWLGLKMSQTDLVHAGQNVVLGLFLLLALVFVVRPMVNRMTAPASTDTGTNLMVTGPDGVTRQVAIAGPGSAIAGLPGDRALAGGGVGAGADLVPAPDDDGMINVANVTGRLRAASLRQIATLVNQHPEESLNIVRGWLAKEGSQ
ncbi:flagellar M-ring protein FliF [Acetobacteraceae bacterium KSS8]|uniref:Flagellar M-ring protein n=1 Tax=Endosaccharibacter trunci TaxID=2812733 RepID=A0ABT1WCU0_9PROT|nr:flagellar M-ring protein FliF [Acetobacteraceae bacterium KSS8]